MITISIGVHRNDIRRIETKKLKLKNRKKLKKKLKKTKKNSEKIKSLEN